MSAYIINALRTPIGSFGGQLACFRAPELGARVIKNLIEGRNLDLNSYDQVIMGNVLSAGLGQAPARQAAILAGLNVSTECLTINKMCGSGLKAVMIADNEIKSGAADIVVAGGMESMSNAPQLLKGHRTGQKMGDSKLIDSMIHDGLWDVYNDMHMGNTGEVVAKECSIDRHQADQFAAQSHIRAAKAWDEGWFDWECFPISIPQRRGDPIVMVRDEGVRSDSTAESLSKLRTVFDKEGIVTAGNASTLNDGASAVLVTSESFANEQGWDILATIEDYCTAGVEPERVMSAPIPAVKNLLKRNDLDVLDVDVYEHNEAFASASCAVAQEIGIPQDRFNLHGGAVSIGHPLGSSGSRCLITMLGIMRRLDAKSGIVTLCLGGGNAVAMYLTR